MCVYVFLLFIDGSELLGEACVFIGQIGSHLSCDGCSAHPVLVQYRGTTHITCNTHTHFSSSNPARLNLQLLASCKRECVQKHLLWKMRLQLDPHSGKGCMIYTKGGSMAPGVHEGFRYHEGFCYNEIKI